MCARETGGAITTLRRGFMGKNTKFLSLCLGVAALAALLGYAAAPGKDLTAPRGR